MSRKHFKMLIICSLKNPAPQNNLFLCSDTKLKTPVSCASEKNNKEKKKIVICKLLGHNELPEQLQLMWAQILQVSTVLEG